MQYCRDCAGQLVSLFPPSKDIRITLVSLCFASDPRSEAINSEKLKKMEAGRQVQRCTTRGREGEKGISIVDI